MVILLVGIIAAVVAPAMIETGDAWLLSSRFQDNAVSSAIVAMNRMSRDIRRLKDDTSIITATQNSSSLTFVDLDSNTITYSLIGTTLTRTIGVSVDGLADNVVSLNFQYFDDLQATPGSLVVGLGNYTNIRLIQVNFVIRPIPGDTGKVLNFQFKVRPQNLRRPDESH